MLNLDAGALRCDMAETYHIYDLEALPVSTVALLASGLRDDSRIKMKATGAKAPEYIMLLAQAVDRLSYLVWFQTKDGHKGRNKPVSIVDTILNADKPVNKKPDVFRTLDDFYAERERLIKQAERR